MGLFAWLEQSSLSVWIDQSGSVFAYPSILLLHTIGLTLLVGINLVIALRVLGASSNIPLGELRRLFPFIWVGLAINGITGVLLFAAKATQFVVNPIFYVKLTAVAVAVGLFFAMKGRSFRESDSDETSTGGKDRVLALGSIVFWLLAVSSGRAMAYVGEAVEFTRLLWE